MKTPKDGTIETVEQMIECLKKCDPKAKLSVRPVSATVNIVQEPGSKTAYVEVNA